MMISLSFFLAAFKWFSLTTRTASYPPKHVLRQKSLTCATVAFASFLLALILYYVT
ncbi:conserved hypothetical protein [Priestia megaterium]